MSNLSALLFNVFWCFSKFTSPKISDFLAALLTEANSAFLTSAMQHSPVDLADIEMAEDMAQPHKELCLIIESWNHRMT